MKLINIKSLSEQLGVSKAGHDKTTRQRQDKEMQYS